MYAMLVLLLLLGGCSAAKATYMKGGDNSMAVIDVTMTGAKITINGPFTYCSEPAVMATDPQTAVPDSICVTLIGGEEKPESSE